MRLWLTWSLLPALFTCQACFPLLGDDGTGLPKVMVFRPEGEAYEDALNGIRAESETGFIITDYPCSNAASAEEMGKNLKDGQPTLVVLMENRIIRLFSECQKRFPETRKIPSISIMAIHLEKQLTEVKNATGISYEVPGYIVYTNLRSLTTTGIKKVGVIYRDTMESFFLQNKQAGIDEKVALIGYKILTKTPNFSSEIRKGLSHLIKEEKVDAIWVFNDSFILKGDLLRSAWLPKLRRFNGPVVVGVERLISNEVRVGHLALVPDHYALGTQTVNLIYEIQDKDWQASYIPVQKPLSVRKILNIKTAEKSFDLNIKVTMEVDKILE